MHNIYASKIGLVHCLSALYRLKHGQLHNRVQPPQWLCSPWRFGSLEAVLLGSVWQKDHQAGLLPLVCWALLLGAYWLGRRASMAALGCC